MVKEIAILKNKRNLLFHKNFFVLKYLSLMPISMFVPITLNKTSFKYIDLPWRYKGDRY